MNTTMDRIRLVLLVDDEVRAALKSEAAEQGKEMSVLADEILRAALGEAVARVREQRAAKKKKGG